MPAVFVNLVQDDIFKSGGNASHLIKIPKVDDIIGKEGIALYDSVTAQLGETIQYFLTFDDVIKFIHFGKGVGSIVVEGTMYCDCPDHDLPGLPKFMNAFKELRGKDEQITIGNETFNVIVTQANVSIVGEPLTSAKFTFNFAVVNHQL